MASTDGPRFPLRIAPMALAAIILVGFAAGGRAADEEVPSEAELPDGKELVENNCLVCHQTDRPEYPNHNLGWVFGRPYDRTRWADNVNRMEKIALRDEYISEPWSDADEEAMVKYLTDETASVRSKWVEVGMSHFAVVHFPIALLFLAGLAELVAIPMGWPPRRDGVHVVVWLATLSCAASVALGLALASNVQVMGEDLLDHRMAGIFALVFAAIAVLVRELAVATQKGWATWTYRLVLVLAILSVGFAGHLGGRIIHGEYVPLPFVLTS